MIRDDWPQGRYQPPPANRLVPLTVLTFNRIQARLMKKAGILAAQLEPARQLVALHSFTRRLDDRGRPYVVAFDEHGNKWASFPDGDGVPWALVSLESCGLWHVDGEDWYAPDPLEDEDLWEVLGWELEP